MDGPQLAAKPLAARPVTHRFVLVLRVPVERLADALPHELEPVERDGSGIVMLDTSRLAPVRLAGLRLGAGAHVLSWKVPVRIRTSDHRAVGRTSERRGLWVPRRWTSAGRLARWTGSRFADVRRLTRARMGQAAPLVRGSECRPRPARFEFREEGLHVELDVRTAGAHGHRAAYLRAEAYGSLSGSMFATPRVAEETLESWGPPLDAVRGTSERETPCFATGTLGLQPLTVRALQTASLPELLPGVESDVTLDSAFRAVRRRREPLADRLTRWRELSQGQLGMPPEGAFSLS